MCSIEVIKSIHGGKVLSVNNFLYILNKNYKRKRDDRNVFYWTCSTKCGAKICTVETSNGEHEIDEFSTFSEDQHSHAADPIAIEAKKIKENIKQQALTSNVEKPIQIFHAAISGTTKIISSHITKESAKQIVKRQRRINLNQNEPETIQSIDPPQSLCTTLSGEYFLVKKTESVLLFTTKENCKYLQESKCWLADGTFKSCPNIFQQLYCIHASIKRGSEEIYVPLVYCLLVGKSQSIYSEMFNLINQYCNENDIDITKNSDLEIITDFEIAAINAINEVYPFAMHSTCFFHFCQNIYRKIQNVGLSTKYSEDADFNLLTRHIPAMAFLPIDMIQEAWSLLKPLFNDNNEEKSLITYFEETYVLGKIGMRTRGRPNNVPSRNPPLFSPDIWSVSNRVRSELPRTTNTAESWHRKLNRLTSPHPGLHKFITIVQKIQSETESQIEMLISGHQIKKKKYGVDRNMRLQSIQQRIIDNPKYCKLEFLKAIAYNLSF